MSKFHVIVSDQAIADIDRNARWWATHRDQQQALAWFELAFEAVYSLDTLPARHALSPENDDFGYEIRDLLFGVGSRPTHRMIFTIQDTVVHVLSVRRGSQDKITPADIDFSIDD